MWVNGDSGVTFRIGVGTAQRFAKWAPAGSGIDLEAESVRLQWASRFATVPQVLDFGSSAAGAWLVTVALAGESAITDRWKASPEIAVRVAGAGLRELHENGRFAGHVDLGSLGVADRWVDLAIGTCTTEWNYGPGREDLYLASYGIEPDTARIDYYRELWNLAHPV